MPASPLPTLRRRATLRRSLGLLTDFRFEQTDPHRQVRAVRQMVPDDERKDRDDHGHPDHVERGNGD